jgi:hypothetical protein
MTGVQKRDSLFAMRLMETRLQDRAIMRATDAEEFGEHVDLMRELDADVASGRFVQPQNTPEFRPPKTNKSIEKIKEAAADTLEFYDGDKARAIKELREDIGDGGKIIEGHHNVLFEDIAKELESPAGTLTVRAEPGAEGKPQTLVEGVRPVTDADRIALEAERALTGEAKPLDIGATSLISWIWKSLCANALTQTAIVSLRKALFGKHWTILKKHKNFMSS